MSVADKCINICFPGTAYTPYLILSLLTNPTDFLALYSLSANIYRVLSSARNTCIKLQILLSVPALIFLSELSVYLLIHKLAYRTYVLPPHQHMRLIRSGTYRTIIKSCSIFSILLPSFPSPYINIKIKYCDKSYKFQYNSCHKAYIHIFHFKQSKHYNHSFRYNNILS